MTREEIGQSKEYIFAREACKYVDKDPINAFEEGAEYGYKFAIEKACEWLRTDSKYYWGTEDDIDEMIEDFKKAMEE